MIDEKGRCETVVETVKRRAHMPPRIEEMQERVIVACHKCVDVFDKFGWISTLSMSAQKCFSEIVR